MSARFSNSRYIYVAPTGTGSVYFSVSQTPYQSLQVAKLTGSMTVEKIEVFGSNLPGNSGDSAMLTGSSPDTLPGTGASQYYNIGNSAYWSQMDELTLTTPFSSSAAPASIIQNLGNIACRFVNVRVYSITGGHFVFVTHGKE